MLVVRRVFRQNEYRLLPEPDLRLETGNENSRVLGPRLPEGGGGPESILVRKKVVNLDCAADGAVSCDQEVPRKPAISVPYLAM